MDTRRGSCRHHLYARLRHAMTDDEKKAESLHRIAEALECLSQDIALLVATVLSTGEDDGDLLERKHAESVERIRAKR